MDSPPHFFGWPEAMTAIGILATLAIAIIRYGPRPEANGKGQIYAKAVDFAEVKTRLVALEAKVDKMDAKLDRALEQ